jgi:hypothetical protein
MFVQRLKDAREACGTKVCAALQPGPKGAGAVLIAHNAILWLWQADASNPVTVFLDELHELAHSPHARPVIAKIVDAMRDSKLSLGGREVLDIRGWVFLFATDIHEKTVGGQAFREFTTRWVNEDLAADAVRRRYDQSFHDLITLLSDEHSHEYEAFRFGSTTTVDNFVVFMPCGFRMARQMLVAMVQQSNEGDGFRSAVAVTEALLDDIVDNELPYDTVSAGCGSGARAEAEDGACLAERVVNGGGRAVRLAWEKVEIAVVDMLMPFRTCTRSVLEASTAGTAVLCPGHHFVVGLRAGEAGAAPRLVVCQVTDPDAAQRAAEVQRLVHDIGLCPGYALAEGPVLHRRHA